MFIFRKRNLSAVPNVNGTDVDFLSIPKDSLVSINMSQRKVILYFVNGNSYSNFTGGTTNIRGYEYAQVTLSVDTNDELLVIYEITSLLSQDRSTITFDNVNGLFDVDRVTSIDSIKRFENLSILDTDPSAGGLPSGSADGQVVFWDTVSADWVVSPYALPTTDGSANQVLQTDGSGAVSFQSISSTDSVVLAATTTQARLNVNDNYYTGSDDFGWNYVIWVDPSTFSTSFTDTYANMGIIIPKDITTLEFLSTIERFNGNGTGITVELFTAPRPNGSTSNLTLSSIGSVSVDSSTTGLVNNGDISLTGLSISKGTLLFVAIKKTGGTNTTTYCKFNYTIIVS